MHSSEWLDLAKQVPVGQSRRHYHGAESRPNLVVFNNPDSWSAYCHSCKTHGKINKQYLEPVDTSVPIIRKYLNTSKLCALNSMDKVKFKNLALLLHSKHMSTAILDSYNPMYNTEDDRLVFIFEGVRIGRDTTGRSPAKWLHYHTEPKKEYVYLQGKKLSTCEPLILVEDLFSAMKINHYTGWSTLCCLGTRISDEIISFVGNVAYLSKSSTCTALQQEPLPYIVVAAFDGDSAGRDAERSLVGRLGLRGIRHSTVRIPDGLDPKDLSHTQLIETFKFLETVNV